MNGFNDEQLLDIRKGRSENAKLNALVKLAADITQNRGKARNENVEDFFAQGYPKENLVEVII